MCLGYEESEREESETVALGGRKISERSDESDSDDPVETIPLWNASGHGRNSKQRAKISGVLGRRVSVESEGVTKVRGSGKYMSLSDFLGKNV